MICPSCGFNEDSKFCKHCGAPMVSESKANFLGTPQFTGITIPPPSASEGFKADDLDAVGLEDGDFHDPSSESKDSWFGVVLVGIMVVALIAWGISRVTAG